MVQTLADSVSRLSHPGTLSRVMEPGGVPDIVTQVGAEAGTAVVRG